MRNKSFVDCFTLMNMAIAIRGGQKLPEMGRPVVQDVFTTFVNLSFALEDLRIVNPKTMEFEVTGLLNQRWVDPRLGANLRTRKMAVAGQIWKPKIINSNGKNLLDNNEDTLFWRGFGDEGNVLLSEKVQIKNFCTSNFKKFPFDTQFCEVKFGSYRFPNEEVSILWSEESIDIFTEMFSNEFHLTNVTTSISKDIRLSGNFSIAVIQFTLKRRSSHYLICTITPTVLLVFLNYLSLWLDIGERKSRFYINILILAANLFFYFLSTCILMATPYLKALDIFVTICGSFSLITLLETFGVDILCENEELQFHLKKTACTKEYPKIVYWLEFGFRISYPVFFTFFITLYAAVYVNVSEN